MSDDYANFKGSDASCVTPLNFQILILSRKVMVHFLWVDGVIVRCESIAEVIETMTAAQEA